MVRASLILRFLGEMEVVRNGSPVPLPPSKKTRALLAYLAVSGGQHRRERLCSLLWDVADDPRGALRWSLSKLRAIVDGQDLPRIVTDRENVAFQAHQTRVDLLAIQEKLRGGADAVPLQDLQTLASEFRGEFLEGVDLSDFHDFHAWCVAMREDARKAQVSVLGPLTDRLEADPARALPYARALVQADPFAVSARARLLRLLAASGRPREAVEQYECSLRILEETGPVAAAALRAAWEETRARTHSAPATSDVPASAGVAASSVRAERGEESFSPESTGAERPREPEPLVGREAETRRLREILEEVTARRGERAALIYGEPGIGKSRLLAVLASEARARGGMVLEGRCFEAECGRPYGPWMEALQRVPPASIGRPLAAALAPLLGTPSAEASREQTRERLFGAVVDLIAARAAAPSPVLIAVDDAHWCDAASAELMHFVARLNLHRPVLLAIAAREGELLDNDPARRLLRGLRSQGISEEIRLGPLEREGVEALVRAIAPEADAPRVAAESGGNPLFAKELARAERPSDEDVPPRLGDLIRDRIDRLGVEPTEVLRWAATLGCGFRVDRLARVVSLDPDRLVVALESLERHALLAAAATDGAEGRYAFSHDVVRRVVYADLSEPRRRVMHAKVARVISESSGGEESAADLAHHAGLAGDAATAALACVEAGRRCLRLFAGEDARVLSRRGARFADQLPEPDRTRRLIELAEIRLSARRPAAAEDASAEIEALADRAIDLGSFEHARRAFHLLGWLRWEEGDAPGARRHVMRAEEISRSTDERGRALAMGEAARCLAILEKDLGKAEALALEAAALSRRAGFEHAAVADALGMLRLHEGRLEEAADLFRRARALSRRDGDPMGEFLAIEHLVAVEMERGDGTERRLASELVELGGKLREGSEAPFARAIEALSRRAAGDEKAKEDLDRALEDLRGADAKQRLAFVLIRASRLDLERGDPAKARSRAEEALALAEALNISSEVVLARAILVRASDDLGDRSASGHHREALEATPASILSAAARSAREELAAAPPRSAREPRRRRAR